MTPWVVTRWNYRQWTPRRRRLLFKAVKRCLGGHDIYSHVARQPSLMLPRNALKNGRESS